MEAAPPTYLFEPEPVPTLPIQGMRALYPVRRIFCIGRNYAAAVRDQGKHPEIEPPCHFLKPAAALVPSGSSIPYPPGTAHCQCGIELVVAIGGPAFRVPRSVAPGAVYGYAAGLNLTRRDLLLAAREWGRPWDAGKAAEQSAVVGELVPVGRSGQPAGGSIRLAINGEMCQSSDIADMIWDVPSIIADLSRFYHLGPGDIVFTGTPTGGRTVRPGDILAGAVAGIGEVGLMLSEAEG